MITDIKTVSFNKFFIKIKVDMLKKYSPTRTGFQLRRPTLLWVFGIPRYIFDMAMPWLLFLFSVTEMF